jgi:hypothetical protein
MNIKEEKMKCKQENNIMRGNYLPFGVFLPLSSTMAQTAYPFQSGDQSRGSSEVTSTIDGGN